MIHVSHGHWWSVLLLTMLATASAIVIDVSPNHNFTVNNYFSTISNSNGSANYVTKFYNSSTLVNTIIYDTGSQVCVGCTNPNATLHVVGNFKINGDEINVAWIKNNQLTYNNGTSNLTVAQVFAALGNATAVNTSANIQSLGFNTTAQLANVFYPLTANPAGYLTSASLSGYIIAGELQGNLSQYTNKSQLQNNLSTYLNASTATATYATLLQVNRLNSTVTSLNNISLSNITAAGFVKFANFSNTTPITFSNGVIGLAACSVNQGYVYNGSQWICGTSASDGNNYTTGISFWGTTTKTLELSRVGMANLTASFTDSDTTYTNGTGLNLTGTTFSVYKPYFDGLYYSVSNPNGYYNSKRYDHY